MRVGSAHSGLTLENHFIIFGTITPKQTKRYTILCFNLNNLRSPHFYTKSSTTVPP